MAQKILLTGGAGYIGSHTYVALIEAGFEVVILDNFSISNPSVLIRLGQITRQNQVICYEGSVLDKALLAQIFTEHDISAVIHFAALKAVGESVEQPLAYFSTNITGLLCLLETMKTAGIKHLVFSSSTTVYGEPEEVPISETAPLQFTNPYGFTQVASEQILTQAAAADPWTFGVLRYFNPAGAHPSGLIGEDPFDIPNNLMPYIAKVASGALPHLNVFGNDYDTRDGTGERDYIHVCDLAQGHVLSLQKLLSTHEGHVVNLGTGQAYSVLEMNAAYGEAVGRDLPYVIAPRRPGDVPTCLADVRKAKKVLGFETQFGLADMCQSSWNWIETQARS